MDVKDTSVEARDNRHPAGPRPRPADDHADLPHSPPGRPDPPDRGAPRGACPPGRAAGRAAASARLPARDPGRPVRTASAMTTVAAGPRSADGTADPRPPGTSRARKRGTARTRYPARPAAGDWPATRRSRRDIEQRLCCDPFTPENPGMHSRHRRGLAMALDWLEDQPGTTWQQRWLASGSEAAGLAWRQLPAAWLRSRGRCNRSRLGTLTPALLTFAAADIIRPSLGWLVSGAAGQGILTRRMSRCRDPDGFARLRAVCGADPGVPAAAAKQALHRASLILAAKGGAVSDITIGDVLSCWTRRRTPSVSRRLTSPCSTGRWPRRASSAARRPPRCGNWARRASAHPGNSSTATRLPAVPSVICSCPT